MEEWIARLLENISDRLTGPLHFRFFLQPGMAAFAIRDGMKDAREGRPPYFWTFFTQPKRWKELIRDGWSSVGRVFGIALIMDVAYQLYVLKWFYVLETLIVALSLAVIPYLLLRGPISRLAQALKGHAGPPSSLRGAK